MYTKQTLHEEGQSRNDSTKITAKKLIDKERKVCLDNYQKQRIEQKKMSSNPAIHKRS